MSSERRDGAVLALEDVSKRYPAWRAGERSLKDLLRQRVPGRHRRGEQRWAVHGVTLHARPGESVGLIGGNGAGKSTLLRIASGLVLPTSGTVRATGELASVLTLGETFALDLTGSENAVTSAIVAGFTPREARERLPAMLAYAELEDAAEAPVRTYSEGMKLRLAFAVVAQLRPAVMLLDEVMAVGDLRFQLKAQARIRQARDEGTALLVASHDIDALTRECDRVVWLERGHVRLDGPADEVVGAYRRAMLDETMRRTPSDVDEATGDGAARPDGGLRLGSREATLDDVVLEATGERGRHVRVRPGEPLAVEAVLRAAGRLPAAPIVSVGIFDAEGACCVALASDKDGCFFDLGPHDVRLRLELERLDLVPGTYRVEIGAYREDWQYAYDFHGQLHEVEVLGPPPPRGVVAPPHRWRTG